MRADAAHQVRLSAVTAQWASRLEHWFTDPEVIRWLGPATWIHQAAAMCGAPVGDETFRGSRVLRAHGWVGLDPASAPVGYIGGDVYDRWVRSDEVDERTSMGLAFVVHPGRRRQGWGRALLEAVISHPDVAGVEVFFLGIEEGNVASSRLASATGFTRVNDHPDDEDMVYWRLSR
jgi:GNAT superfamily N-acetyltransferase